MTETPTIADGSVVTMHYSLTLDSGQVVDSSEGKDPLGYLHGAGNIVPGLESAMAGHSVGDSFEVEVSPEEGYGPRHEEAVQTAPRGAFPAEAELQAGLQFQARGPEDQPLMGTILDVSDEKVKVDFNHPLAGETLHFKVDVVDIRAATAEEQEHGHVH